jgi:hypothetical protein
MKNNMKRLTYVVVLISVLLVLFLWERSRTETLISIVSASSSQGTTNEKVTVQYRLNSAASDFTLIVLPDTQHYSDQYPEIYGAQTQWIMSTR